MLACNVDDLRVIATLEIAECQDGPQLGYFLISIMVLARDLTSLQLEVLTFSF